DLVPGNIFPNTTSAGNWKMPTSAAAMKPRIERLSTTRPKKPLRSPATNQGRRREVAGVVGIGIQRQVQGKPGRRGPARGNEARLITCGRGDGQAIAPLPAQKRVRSSTPQVRGSLRKPVRLLKSIAPTTRVWSVMLRPNSATCGSPGCQA